MKKSKRSQACEISRETKYIVNKRDHSKCLLCGRYVDVGGSCCHLIPRSHGGLGIEQNILTLCSDCHREFDNGAGRHEKYETLENYLKDCYPGWNKEQCTYSKW